MELWLRIRLRTGAPGWLGRGSGMHVALDLGGCESEPIGYRDYLNKT